MDDITLQKILNRLVKWRSVFAGWQLGTRPDTDPECQAVRDHREVTILLRAEVNALIALLTKANVFTQDELKSQVAFEAEMLQQQYERRFPGFRATDIGMTVDVHAAAGYLSWVATVSAIIGSGYDRRAHRQCVMQRPNAAAGIVAGTL